MGRAPCCDKANVKRGPWSPEEDTTLRNYLEKHGTGGNWIALPHKAGLKRCGKSCRLRWLNYLRPDIKHGGFTDEEDKIICSLYKNIGSKWSIIASHLPGRTDNDVKNYWNTKLKKKQLAATADLTSNPLVSVVKREDICYSYSTPVGESSSKLQSENVHYGCNVDYKRLLSDPAQFLSPEPPRLPEFCKNESSSLPMDSSCMLWSGNGGSEFDNFLMDFGYGSWLEVPEKMGEIPPNLANFSYVNLLANCESTPQGLFKRVSY